MKHSQAEPGNERIRKYSIGRITSCVLVLALVLSLLLLDRGFADNLEYGIGSWKVPSGQPEQMWSPVDYDPMMTDPFFKSNKWSYPWYIIKHPDGHFEDTTSDKRPEKEPPRLKHTAKCFSTSLGCKHSVEFCEARLLDVNMIDLFIHHWSPGFNDALRVRIRNGMFTCQYWLVYNAGPTEGLIWTTKRQKLTLDKKTYRKGDVIKGRIDFECLDEFINPKYPGRPPRPITINGVFKTIVE
jgi:hypothetical protein